ncbi:transcriptional regulator [Paenibacillus sp. 598K]|uniref:helix-turn-helix domain-containing protein n=1 Tax=Paenibacillus sp. 598K TaxID=1117987 RepID=UPI000FF92A19|nr:helix-turn-helix transcriptional regulator [Paenibacillus sp. 598K]GBF73186.1 transcriptional regulator [Paenibacillus sp. 598K]
MSENFGEYLKGLRKAQGLTLEQLSNLADVSVAQLSRLETGKRKQPEQKTLIKLANALESTTYMEMMAAAGYLDDLTETEIIEHKKKSESMSQAKFDNQKNSNSDENEREFYELVLDLSDEDVKEGYTIIIDGQEVSEEEYKRMIAIVRMERQLRNGQD